MKKHLCFEACATMCILAAMLLVAGCGGSQSPIGAPDAVPQSHDAPSLMKGAAPPHVWTPSLAVPHGWMSSAAMQEDLGYVCTTENPNAVFVYDYKTGAMVGELGDFNFYEPGGMCVDKTGDVWITSTDTGQIVEYAHGGVTPLQTLNTDQNPVGCSVAPNG